MPAKKGQKFKEYTFETKVEAIQLHIEEGWTYRKLILQHDHGVWMNHKKILRLMQVLGIRSQIRLKHRLQLCFFYGRSCGEKSAKTGFQGGQTKSKMGYKYHAISCG
ncbi:hypothetical protein [Paenibacillus terrae]|uniref:hypothetical protein n=1 Tax=Paenibacillus terrae TaxID=159743 RepID=UPI000AD05B1C|nr:hypothetical protein [Paenibacillus terrae]